MTRELARRLAFALAALAAACGRVGPQASPPIVIISIDTLRADRLPAYGSRSVATPNIDRLRRDGVLFENAYAPAPQTLPSHASLFTGLLPPQHGLRDNAGFVLSERAVTLASLLQGRGIATGAAISAPVMDAKTGIARGFGLWEDSLPPGTLKRDGGRTAAALLPWIRQQHGPFLAFLHLFEPHVPRDAPRPHSTRYADAYDAEISRADEIVGEFLDELRRLKLYDRSLILLVSDHGEGLGDHGEKWHGVLIYRETIHVPLLMKLPGSRHAGETVRAAVGLVDALPTVARAHGIAVPPGVSGVALQRYVEGDPPAGRRIYSESLFPRLRLGWSDLASLSDERFQYIEAPEEELYDLAADPKERRNVARERLPVLRERKAEMSRIPRPFELPAMADPEKVRVLASLGYLSGLSPDASRAGLPDPKARIAAGAFDVGEDILRLLGSSGRDSELVAACRRYVTDMPGALDMWRTLARALDRLGRTAEAVEALEESLRCSTATALPSEQAETLELLAQMRARAKPGREPFSPGRGYPSAGARKR